MDAVSMQQKSEMVCQNGHRLSYHCVARQMVFLGGYDIRVPGRSTADVFESEDETPQASQ